MKSQDQETPEKSQKDRRLAGFAHHISTFKTACGCQVVLEHCNCQEFCKCSLEVRMCRCEWPIEQVDALGNLLARLDPVSYAARPSPETSPLTLTKKSIRIGFRELRDDGGFSIWHPSDSISEDLKNGGALSRTPNGEDLFLGVAPHLTHHCQYCGDRCDPPEDDKTLCESCRIRSKAIPKVPQAQLKEAS